MVDIAAAPDAAPRPPRISSTHRLSTAVVTSRRVRFAARVGFLLLIVVAYCAVVALSPAAARVLPTIGQLGRAAVELIGAPTFWQAAGFTLACTAIALALSIVAGAAVGVALASHRIVYRSSVLIVDFMRTIPPLALIPVGLLALGPTMTMEVTLIVISAIWPVILQVYFGIRDIEQGFLETARSFRISRIRTIAFIVAPAVGPTFATAVRLSATLCLLLAVGTELLATGQGLGYLISYYQQANRVPQTYALIIMVGLLGLAINGVLLAIERRLFAWHQGAHDRRTP